jgi:hypothetical protein
MAVAYDFLLNTTTNDLTFSDGDLVIGESDYQHIRDTINGHPGWDKEFPTDGVGASSYVNGSGVEQTLQRSIKLQLALDGYDFTKSPRVYFNSDSQLIAEPNAIRR